MKERPILFSAPMVRALLAGTKTQTRRILKQATGPSLSVGMDDDAPGVAELSWLWGDGPGHDVNETIKRVPCPYGQPGDILWVREAWKAHTTFDHLPPRDIPQTHVWYMADDGYKAESRYRQSMHMPRWASRMSLGIVGVRVERLQDISRADAKAEGCHHDDPCDHTRRTCAEIDCDGPDHRIGYRNLWGQINGPESWAANPWVWVVEFKRVTP